MNGHLIIIFRSIVTYFVLLSFTRVMGRKQISQLTYFDYIVGITIGSIAGESAVNNNVKISDILISISIWSLLTILISEITLKNIKLRLLIDSEPLLIIDKGKVIYKNMKKARYNMGDLLMQLRNKDVFYITDVEIAVLEPDGKLSVLKKVEQTAVTVGDMNIKKSKTGMMVDIVLDGNILSSHLSLIQKDEKWVMSQLKARNIDNIKDVIFAGVQPDEQIYIVTKYS
ncbi:DUF421 domain-containing protein [Clostridium estertheticum]|uniref:DUF421 domain-containing protein n=1 Tax=Clostridium estertheticum TaxID=238834 RepID=A0A7Y3ST00_9CLOT|nr:DUF421 domain-containing protein [Clostridium estertheticum]MBW9173153.1 DUF421 domain-containing protein [Clostridium estertheticum]MBX4271366.1 DUF421 domain-containing protein [Clostridium estertheticum]NNU74388.1 DUF421 domain-containing protein [Clostridium estertheticum]WBL49108.1 DUF421 domain-containing protein [Clostridium estertheticum]WLC77202.1 DUF421 domain-containing protein [Clostridium estertheticum]